MVSTSRSTLHTTRTELSIQQQLSLLFSLISCTITQHKPTTQSNTGASQTGQICYVLVLYRFLIRRTPSLSDQKFATTQNLVLFRGRAFNLPIYQCLKRPKSFPSTMSIYIPNHMIFHIKIPKLKEDDYVKKVWN